MKDVLDRFKKCRKELGLTQQEIAEKTNSEQKDISRWETGKAKCIPDKYILYLYNKNVNLNWLYSGKGEMMRDHVNNEQSIQTGDASVMSESQGEYVSLKELRDEIIRLKAENETLYKILKGFGVSVDVDKPDKESRSKKK
ncbi:helix-turn-helix transcriptional regulator [Fulvivirgaceae bacterium BMA10]|uniref:Helix-turn-helix transcriptional regulator n=1 Tax=Splendidivirga corallicola TaxID=3051826 RepID=A0ABT8KNK2_9BACT|nr:helix-turn-helix transcriptional regulator [Fulvivirgaceae bacterium BMA10]